VRGCFVTGTDTGVGKTIVAASLAAALASRGTRVAAFKPVLTGADEPTSRWPSDDTLLASVTGSSPEAVAPLRFGPAVSPHLAAALAGVTIDPGWLLARARATADGAEVIVVEGVGGLRVPLAPAYSVRELARDLGLPLVIAARPGLGTINHTLLAVECARAAGLDVRAVVLTPWPRSPGVLERSNREAIATIGDVAVECLAEVAGPAPEELARAGAELPLADWLEP
jgi:dethiobiotin synthetase